MRGIPCAGLMLVILVTARCAGAGRRRALHAALRPVPRRRRAGAVPPIVLAALPQDRIVTSLDNGPDARAGSSR